MHTEQDGCRRRESNGSYRNAFLRRSVGTSKGSVDNTMPRKVLGGWTPLEVCTGQPIALIA
ncbi:MAG: hypothetical protein QS721_14635 [Candidatus Endonucleobacter sp. (ex Gigantidas childressi)]|nr:hypothetical protein [Candidatus Endonucleobacter sp. (ex Gigantidas childressi)]